MAKPMPAPEIVAAPRRAGCHEMTPRTESVEDLIDEEAPRSESDSGKEPREQVSDQRTPSDSVLVQPSVWKKARSDVASTVDGF
jgi:hypothetical protein